MPSLKVVKPLCRVSPPNLNRCIHKKSLTGMLTGQSNLSYHQYSSQVTLDCTDKTNHHYYVITCLK